MCDWNALEHEYVTGKDSYRKLAKKYKDDPDVTKGKIERYGKNNSWPEKRAAHQDKIKADAVQKSADIASDAIARLTSCAYEAAADLAEKLMIKIKQSDKIKSFEFKNYSSTIIDLIKLIPETEQKESEQTFVAILPDRTEIDE